MKYFLHGIDHDNLPASSDQEGKRRYDEQKNGIEDRSYTAHRQPAVVSVHHGNRAPTRLLLAFSRQRHLRDKRRAAGSVEYRAACTATLAGPGSIFEKSDNKRAAGRVNLGNDA